MLIKLFFILYIFFIYYNFYYIRVSLLYRTIIPNEMLDYENNSSLSQINEKGWWRLLRSKKKDMKIRSRNSISQFKTNDLCAHSGRGICNPFF